MRGNLHIRLLNARKREGEALELASRKQANLPIFDLVQFYGVSVMSKISVLVLLTQHVHDVVHVSHLGSSFNVVPNSFVGSFDGFGDHIYILRFDDSFKIVLENFCEIIYIFQLELDWHWEEKTHFAAQTHESTSKFPPNLGGCHIFQDLV